MVRGRAVVKVERENGDYEDPIDSEEEEEEELDGEEDNPDDYIPPVQLEEYHWHSRTIGELVDLMKGPWLVLDPDYQRNVVWSADRMTRLINSLMSNYYVPPLIFNVKKVHTESGALRFQRICIDGKQRLSSIREFVAGRIPCLDNKKRKWFYCEGDGKGKRRILSDAQKANFTSQPMLCVEYSELKLEQEEELFARVQMGMELRPAEKLKARSGPWQKFAIELEQKYPDLMAKIDNKRGRSFQALLSTFKTLMSDEDAPTYSTGMSSLGPFLEKHQYLDDAFKTRARRVFSTFNKVFKAHTQIFENNNYRHSTKFAPIEFVGVAILIDRHPNRSIGLLAGDIKRMREVLREQRQELRSNITTFRAMVAYIDNLEQYRGGQGVILLDEETEKGNEDVSDDGDDEVIERKPQLVDGVPASSTNRISRPPLQPPPPPLSLPPPPPPPGPAASSSGSSRRGSFKGTRGKNKGGSNTVPSTPATRPAVPVFAPPTAPLAFREKENRQRQQQQQHQQQHELHATVPVSPMSRYNASGRDLEYKPRSNYHNVTGGGPASPHQSYATGVNRIGPPSASSFKAINAPSSFLPDLDADVSYNSRKRPRGGDEDHMLDDLDLDNPQPRRATYPGSRGQQPLQDDGDDVIMYGYGQVRNDNNGGRASDHGNNNGQRFANRGGYRGRGGLGNMRGSGRRIKQERNSGSSGRREIQYGPFTMED